jgi:glutamine cyclotransferase
MKKIFLLLLTSCIVFNACKQDKRSSAISIVSPETGSIVKSGDNFSIDIDLADAKADSIVYLLDSTVISSKKDTAKVSVGTSDLSMGNHIVTAKVYTGAVAEDVSSNIVVVPSKAPELLTFKVVNAYPHDTSSYTEGLLYQDGVLYESDGGRLAESTGQSSLRKTDLKTGKILKKADVDPKVFAEGISVIGNKIIQMTYTEKIGYVYDKSTFKLLSTFNNNVGLEGWGMCFDGEKLYLDDSTNRIWFLDKNTYAQIGYIDVYDDKGPVNQINELEYIDGKIYANIYMTDIIIVIDPKTGVVLQKIDFSSLYPDKNKNNPHAEVMNGIAWDAAGKRLFVTGKKWDKLFEIKLIKQ